MDVTMYERALKRAGGVVAATTPEQLGNPTPCRDWDARRLLNHMIGGCLAFAAGARGESRPFDDGTDHCAGDHAGAFGDAAHAALEAFAAPGAMERTFTMDWGETPAKAALGLALADAAVHGWDLAKATGQDALIDDDIAEALYGMTSSMMEPKGSYPRGESFGEPIAVPDDSSAQDRLLGYLGRRP